MAIIVKWLERNSRKNPEPDLIEKSLNWEQTLHMLKNDRMMNRVNRNNNIVSHIDPDAPVREKKELHALDMEDDKKVLRGAYQYIRTGQNDKAAVFLIESGHMIRAGLIMGSEYTEKIPQFNGDSDNKEASQFKIEGNSKRDLWKFVNFQICEKKNGHKFEGACRGAICGHRKSLLDVSNTWEDKLWAYLKTSVNVREENELRQRSNARYIDLPDEYWNQGCSVEDALEQIADSFDFDIPELFFREIQKYVMMNNIDDLYAILKANKHTLLEDESEDNLAHKQFIRFLVHVLLVMGILELGHDEELLNYCLKKYLKYLVSDGMILHIPFYVSQLSPKHEQEYYMAELICSTDLLALDDIVDILKNASANNMDPLCVGTRVVEIQMEEQEDFNVQNLYWISSANYFTEAQGNVMLALLRYTILITRKFITLGNISKVKELLSQIDSNCLMEVEQGFPTHRDTLIREFTCYQLYMEAQDALNKLKKCASQKPRMEAPEEGNVNDRQFLERKKKEWALSNSKWTKAHDHHLKVSINKFFEVLKFPGGWLCDCVAAEDHEEAELISNVRRVLIPKVTFVLLNMLRESKTAKLVREFVYILCDDNKRILCEFTSEEIGTIFRSVEEYVRTESTTLFQLPK